MRSQSEIRPIEYGEATVTA